MELRDLLPGIIGSFVGVTGWLLVGLYIQRRQFMRQARNAAKAVYFELDVNRSAIEVASTTLRRPGGAGTMARSWTSASSAP